MTVDEDSGHYRKSKKVAAILFFIGKINIT